MLRGISKYTIKQSAAGLVYLGIGTVICLLTTAVVLMATIDPRWGWYLNLLGGVFPSAILSRIMPSCLVYEDERAPLASLGSRLNPNEADRVLGWIVRA